MTRRWDRTVAPRTSTRSATSALLAGIDVGTQGLRVTVLDLSGTLVAEAAEPLAMTTGVDPVRSEQNPEHWWSACRTALGRALAGIEPRALVALAVSSTSGTIVLIGDDGRALRPALMHNDGRAVEESAELAAAGVDGVKPTDPLAKLRWVARHEPQAMRRVRRIVHAADVLVSRLTGEWVTDWSHALKSGYDPVELAWSPAVVAAGVDPALFPPVIAPAARVGPVTARAAAETGLARSTLVLAGMTDGCCSQIAAGTAAPGLWASTLGTTLVIKGVTRDRIVDPGHRIYSHRHPEGWWMPGGASNTGGEWMLRSHPRADLAALDRAAEPLLPTAVLSYPLARIGERFPFVAPRAAGFYDGDPADGVLRYAASLQGVAYLERLGYETLAALGAAIGSEIRAAGGAARSRVWMQLRSDVLGKALCTPELASASAGAAVLASCAVTGEGLSARANAMVRVARRFEPRADLTARHAPIFARFLEALRARGLLAVSDA